MSDAPDLLNPLSEMLALSSYGNTKNILVTMVETSGPLDEQAIKLAAQKTAEKFPRVRSCIKEVRNKGKRQLAWEYRQDLPVQIFSSSIENTDTTVPLLERFVDHLAPRLDRRWDLFQEPPIEFHFVRVAQDHHILGPVIHHVAADAGTASEVGRDFLSNYHEILRGQKPDWGFQPEAMSTSKKRLVKTKKPGLLDFLKEGKQALENMFHQPTLPVGSGSAGDLRQYQIKREFSIEDTERLIKISASKGVSLVDLLAAGSSMAIDQWNDARGVSRGMLTASMSVNMKGRFRGFNDDNNSALLFFKSLPHERQNLGSFMRSISLSRIKQFRHNMDFKFYQDVSRMNAAFRLLPFHLKRPIIHRLMQKHQFSVAVGMLGVIWPAFRNGRPTMESCLTETGNLSITGVHGLGYKLLSNTHLLFIVYFFANKLNIVLAASASLFTREEADAFLELMVANLFQYSELPTSRQP